MFFNFILKRNICLRKLPNKDIIDSTKKFLWRGKPLKTLSFGSLSNGGRNRTGRQTVFHRGGGHKRSFRNVCFNNFPQSNSVIGNVDLAAKVVRIEYDPNRSSWIFLMEALSIKNIDVPIYFYTLATDGIFPGEILKCGVNVPSHNGYRIPLSQIPTGCEVHSIEARPNEGAVFARSAGVSAKIIKSSDEKGYSLLELPSTQRVKIKSSCFATVGKISNPLHAQKILRKAGVSRWLGWRPSTRGVAKNPVDHPHGGRTKGGVSPKTPWGKLTRGVSTRSKKKKPLLKKLISKKSKSR